MLLIIDNAPSHIWKTEEFPNLDIVTLPPNTTSKLQPLDAGIIAAFKCQLRKQQLTYALDIIEQNNNLNPYKIHQLRAMQWVKQAWRELKSTVIQNCWRHTGLLDLFDSGSESLERMNVIVDEGLQEDYRLFVAKASIENAKMLENFLNPTEEDEILQEIEAVDLEERILEAVKTIEQDEEQEAAEDEDMQLYANLSKEETLKALARSIAVCEKEENFQADVVRALWWMQHRIQWQWEVDKRVKEKQLSI